MTWSYSGDPSSSTKDEVRFLIGDTSSDKGYISDEEILYTLMKRKDNVAGAAVDCCQSLLATFASEVTYKIGPEKVDASDRYEHYKHLLTQLKANASEAHADISMAEPHMPEAFNIGMHDNR